MAKDLRGFIAQLEAKSPEGIVRIKKSISPRYEMSALLTHLEKRKRFPLLLFEAVEGFKSPVVINAQASRRLMAMALECEPGELAEKFSERQSKPAHPVEVSDAAVHEVIEVGEQADLTQLPILTHYDVN